MSASGKQSRSALPAHNLTALEEITVSLTAINTNKLCNCVINITTNKIFFCETFPAIAEYHIPIYCLFVYFLKTPRIYTHMHISHTYLRDITPLSLQSPGPDEDPKLATTINHCFHVIYA